MLQRSTGLQIQKMGTTADQTENPPHPQLQEAICEKTGEWLPSTEKKY